MPSTNPRHRRAATAARQSDIDWFAAHPDRDYHSRPAMPFEFPHFGPSDHMGYVTIVQRVRNGDRQIMVCLEMRGSIRTVPDVERFLSLLWSHATAVHPGDAAGEFFSLTPNAHAELLQMAGIDPRSI